MVKKIDIEGVYDIGFSKNPELWINSVDYLLNCNKQSYFDLVLMETLSLGTPVVLIPNFGHDFFIKKTSKGVRIIEKIEELPDFFKTIDKKKDIEMINDNKKLFNEHFTKDLYQSRLKVFCKSLFDEKD